MNKPLKKERKRLAKQVSTNRVQRNYAKQLIRIYQTQTDDIYDVANLHAALYKVAALIKEKFEQDGTYADLDTEHYFMAALNDWKGHDERKKYLKPTSVPEQGEDPDKGEYKV